MSDKALKKAPAATPAAPKSGGTSMPFAGQPRGNAAAQDRLKARGGGSDMPYTDAYGKSAAKGAAFQVDSGQLTFDAEGTEGGRFHSRKAHVPPGPSGGTIGRGYDLGQHTKSQILAACIGVGLSKAAAAAYAKAAGLKGDDARSWLARNKGSLAEISPAQQESLFTTTYGEMSKDVQRISNKKDVVKNYGEADLDEMNPAIKDTLVDLRYRGDYTGKAREKIQGAAADNDLISMTDSLSDRKQWKGVPEDRFKRRAAYLKEAEIQAEGEAYGFNGMPMEAGTPTLAELRKGQTGKVGDAKPATSAKGAGEAPAKAPAGKAPPSEQAGKATGGPKKRGGSGATSADDGWSDSTLEDYSDYLRGELKAIAKLDPKGGKARATVVLKQVERFVAALRKPGILDTFEVARQPLSDKPVGAWVPPELVSSTRELAEIAEGGSGGDWNSRLGAQQYRTQSDNLAAPEATCNVTSMAMVLERLGYSRADVLAAVDREVKLRWLRSQGKGAEGVDLSKVELPKGQWGDEVLRYLDKQQGAGKAYQRLRGRDTGSKERGQMAGAYRNDAQMEDLVDFLLSMLGIDRTTINPAAAKLLGRIETTAGERPAVETIRKEGKNTWDVVRGRVHATLEEGGSAILSIFHKGAGQSGTHLVVPQRVTSGGMVIDDPYGNIRADYDRSKKGDAYAEAGKTRKTSNLRNVPAQVDHDKDGAEDDWKVGASTDLAANERRGESSEQSDAVLSKAWNYVALYRRGGAPAGAGR